LVIGGMFSGVNVGGPLLSSGAAAPPSWQGAEQQVPFV